MLSMFIYVVVFDLFTFFEKTSVEFIIHLKVNRYNKNQN